MNKKTKKRTDPSFLNWVDQTRQYIANDVNEIEYDAKIIEKLKAMIEGYEKGINLKKDMIQILRDQLLKEGYE